MLTTFEITLYTLVIPLLPLTIYSLATGCKAPETGPLAKYYAAEKYLSLVGNLFVLTICANAIARLASHFGYLPDSAKTPVMFAIGTAFGVLNLMYLALWLRASLKIRRLKKEHA